MFLMTLSEMEQTFPKDITILHQAPTSKAAQDHQDGLPPGLIFIPMPGTSKCPLLRIYYIPAIDLC